MLKSPFLMRYNLTVELCSSALFFSFLFQFVHPAVPVGVLVSVVVTVVRVLHISEARKRKEKQIGALFRFLGVFCN